MDNIIIDVMGGDSPEEVTAGAIFAAKAHPDYGFIVCGNKDIINSKLVELNAPENIHMLESIDVIDNNESPTQAIRNKTQSSMVMTLDYLSKHADTVGMISTGSTGALLTGAILKVGRINGIRRPTLASLMPTLIDGKMVCIADSGANVDCKPEYLECFALMGEAYYRAAYGVESPKVALLSVGTEDHKGNELTHAAFELLKADTDINFAGNIEARDALSGDYDVIACDGFAGNVLLKSTEGTAKLVLKIIKAEIKSSKSAMLGSMLMRKAFSNVKKRLDYQSYGGAPFLGVSKLVLKAHGASNSKAIATSVDQLINLHANKLVSAIETRVAKRC